MTTSKDEEWNDYFDDNKRYADIVNGIGCEGEQLVKDTDLQEVDVRRLKNTDVFKTDLRYVFDFIRCAENKDELYKLVSQNAYYKEMDEDAFRIVTNYTNSVELVESKKYETEGGKKNVCKAIRDLMEDSRQEGREEGREEVFESMIHKLRIRFSDEEIAELLKEPLARVQAI